MYKIMDFFGNFSWEERLFFMAVVALTLSAFCFLCLAIIGILRIKKRRKIKREERAKKARNLQFSLPEKDNEFVRERLFHVLKNDKKESDNTKYKEENLQISYAQNLLEKLANAPLSFAERMETQDIANLLKITFSRGEWTAQELRVINDCFLSLLKISAKYAV